MAATVAQPGADACLHCQVHHARGPPPSTALPQGRAPPGSQPGVARGALPLPVPGRAQGAGDGALHAAPPQAAAAAAQAVPGAGGGERAGQRGRTQETIPVHKPCLAAHPPVRSCRFACLGQDPPTALLPACLPCLWPQDFEEQLLEQEAKQRQKQQQQQQSRSSAGQDPQQQQQGEGEGQGEGGGEQEQAPDDADMQSSSQQQADGKGQQSEQQDFDVDLEASEGAAGDQQKDPSDQQGNTKTEEVGAWGPGEGWAVALGLPRSRA